MDGFKKVTSRENPLIKLVSSLQKSAAARRENGLFVLEGLRLCADACDNGIRFDKLIISFSAAERHAEKIAAFAENADDCIAVPDALFKKIGDTENPQGIIALCKIPKTESASIKKNGKYVALENINDPANLGAISRTAEALGADGLILSSGSCDPYSPKAMRASMGTLLRMPTFVFGNFAAEMKSCGLKFYACVPSSSAESISNVKFLPGCAVMIGNEANGLTEETKAAAHKKITIPMRGRAESLNAAAAAAIAVWEMMK